MRKQSAVFFLIGYWLFQPLQVLASYEDAKIEGEAVRADLATAYQQPLTPIQREQLLADAGLALQKLLVERLAPPWYGTQWGFNGTSQTPGEGEIACGYFVTTLLRDAGINLNRVRLAQQASENIIKTLVSADSIRRYRHKPVDDFLKDLSDWGQGVYVVGLDFHVGFLSVESTGVYFIHSSFYAPHAVVRNVASESRILDESRYRVVGRLSDKGFLEGWLGDGRFETVTGR